MRSSSCPVPEEALEPLLLLGKKIEEKLGLVCTDKRRADIWRSVARTASARSESPLGVLLGLAGASPEEELPVDFVADLTVGETFFFRERKALGMFSETALPEIAAGKGTAPIRIWSAGCSSGEEPYTLSMLLLNALPGMDPEQ
ncbi:MAG TPA: CheR family methyltransferase, partial [Aminivibrio sp.]|nr:CheR family methyltransferase [Aminivibrio sp.]